MLKKVKATIKDPKLAVVYLLNTINSMFIKKYPWYKDPTGRLMKRKYGTYSEYLAHQKSKLDCFMDSLTLREYDVKYRIVLRERLRQQGIVRAGMTVLCLAARLGTEVKSFLDLGCFAVGIDLNPGKENKYVVYGYFHDCQFPTRSVDVVFTNSVDHVFDFDRFINETKRVLKPDGLFVLEIYKGEEEGVHARYYESVHWKKIDDVLELFLKSGFRIIKTLDFNYPWHGQHISFALNRISDHSQ